MGDIHFIFIGEGTNGGTATLAIRMTEWLRTRNYKVSYLYQKTTNGALEKELMNAGAIMVKNRDCINGVKQIIRTERENEIICFSFVVELYIIVEVLKKRFKLSICNYMYVVNLWSFQRLESDRKNVKYFIGKLLKKFLFKKLCLEMNHYKNLIFMDKDSLYETEKYFELSLENPQIMYLPIKIDQRKQIKHIRNKDTFIVTTIARIEFPFKGYVLGLIDLCTELSEKYKIELNIIGDGSDFYKLQTYVKKKKIKDKIHLFGNQPYNRLSDYLQESDLFVGMGTTVIDAALKAIPVIPVRCHSMECLGNQYFHESTLLAPQFHNDESSYCMKNLIEKAISCSEEEYLDMGQKSRRVVEEKYDINIFMKQLLSLRSSDEIDDTLFYALEKKIYVYVWNMLRRQSKDNT